MNLRKKINTTFLLLLTAILISSIFPANAQITTGTLIKEMTGLKNLAEYPSPYYNTIQFSSYDRRSTSPDAPGWFENSDGFGREPIPGFEKVIREQGNNRTGEYLICDIEGPGAIVRLWSAAINGKIRMYLDNDTTPLYNGNAYAFFTDLYKTIALGNPVDYKGSFTQNRAGYYPVPFAKRCKIIWEGNIKFLHFYHVNIRQYEKGTPIRTFSPDDINTYSEEIKNARKILADPDLYSSQSQAEILSFADTVNSNNEKEVLNIKGAKGIKYMEMKILNENQEQMLRQNILRISFDGASDPQVQSPVGDFFGTAAGINPYSSLPLSVDENGKMTCRFYMPFQDSASIKIENLGNEDVHITGKVITEDYTWKPNSAMYFRAKWRADHDLSPSDTQPFDIPYLNTNGKGVCVGAAAHLMNPSDVPSSHGNWWGEGDEKIYVDDEPFPVFFGTGSEDYFNYAWSSPEIFCKAYCGQPRDDGPDTRGFVTNYRWHILDNIPFKNHFSFYMELLTHEPVEGFSYARIIYHYGFKGMYDDNKRISKGDVRPLKLPEVWFPLAKKGAANSVFYQVEDLLSSKGNTSVVSGALWAGGKMLEWNPKAVGEKLELNLPITNEGNYRINITARLTKNSGAVNTKINGSNFNNKGGNIDLTVTHGILSRTFESTFFKLTKGEQKLVLESLMPDQSVGLDFIWIREIPKMQ